MPLWFVVREGTLWAWTFGKSQKTRNLERDPRATLQLEAGEEYQELRGIMLETEVTVHTDLETVLGVGVEVLQRYGGGAALDEGAAAVAKQPRCGRCEFNSSSGAQHLLGTTASSTY
jgi:hypothetical protein